MQIEAILHAYTVPDEVGKEIMAMYKGAGAQVKTDDGIKGPTLSI